MMHCICPYCKQETGIGTAALFDTVFMSRKICDKSDAQSSLLVRIRPYVGDIRNDC
jgi:hypothetical protein